jgi:hypothetical protein
MVSEIGLMIGFYVITRMISFLTRKELREESLVAKIFSALTILVTIVIMVDLLVRGVKID